MKEKVEILEKTVIELTNKIADLGLAVSERYEQLDKVVPALVKKVLSLESEGNKPAAQAAGADPCRCNSTNRPNSPLQ